jgi:hypothetical protein
MFRTTIIVFATAAALGISPSSAVPLNGAVIANGKNANEPIQRVGWVRQRQHQYFAAARIPRRDEFCYLRGRRGDPHLFMRQQARGCF